MKRALATWQLLSESLRRGEPAVLLYVVQSAGSSPGRQGFIMAVNAAGDMQGSIGGGIMEHKLVQLARERLAQPALPPSLHRQIHNKTAPKDQSGMICSGEQTILLYPVQPSDADAVQQIVAALEHEQAGVLTLAPTTGLAFERNQKPGQADYGFTQESAEGWLYREKLGYQNQLHIIGGGHCALAFARLMHTLDFHIQLYEDRPALNTFLTNAYTHAKNVVSSYSDLASLVPEGDGQYVVIMTFGYRTDDVALRALLSKNVSFLGVLGSKKKIEKMLGDYRAEGIPPEQLERLHAPVGLPIKSQTPEEIAISIAAQIIAVKNKAQARIL
ncbi:XdhC family protein [Hymenobacter crusticola]|uniref:Xanthine dehydrogenase n=1 Tax=Hymenobacter crusticola TaxID=1770526 RepID=A0A243WGI7_9BACT|nr:XdhC/CoxI family protein [Hymenobacter crusticola]OUJ74627.1 xanthine dehydrogenase [Hymenobacter crusticola]